MTHFPETRSSLLVRVQQPGDEEAWRQFVVIYRPAVYRLARMRGLQDADAEDVAQRVIISVHRAMESWRLDPQRGRFRAWLASVAENAILNEITRRPRDLAAGGDTNQGVLAQQMKSDQLTRTQLQLEYRRSLFRWAANSVRGEFQAVTWEAFWLSTVEGQSVEQTAQRLGKSLGSIYTARSRIVRRLREVIEQYEQAGGHVGDPEGDEYVP